ncbi:MAG TPA: ABC transporter permease [Candidatus Methylacidiphilales bacterium]|jgi:peptide/nickel transport system permease protein/oligopeptide transport system permease protein|nr:ABC transporter permease [Candidatus Methylacidiphilales bacterium]
MKTLGQFFTVIRRDRLLILCALFIGAIALLAAADFLLPFFHDEQEHPYQLTGYAYDAISNDSLQQPSWSHWFGTDVLGHDLLSRTLFGAQISLLVAAVATLMSLIIGVTYGMISGYAGGRIDNIMMRLVEIVYSLPTLVLVIVVVTTLDDPAANLLRALGLTGLSPRLVLIIAFLGLTEWFTMARIIRGQVLVLKEQAFVQAAQALGQSHFRILWSHLLPNLSGLIVVYLTLTIPAVMLDESFMSFLGVGVQQPLASWGTLVANAAGLINPVHSYWWLLVFPGACMTLTLLALNFLGDGLRDALDPRVKK